MPEINYFWDEIEDNVVREYDENNNTITTYTTEPTLYGSVLSQERVGEVRHYQFDGKGNTTELTDNNESVTDQYRNSAYGSITQRVGATPCSYVYLAQHGFHTTQTVSDVRRRKYSLALTRWMSTDPLLPAQFRPHGSYTYASANPLTYDDPSGLFCIRNDTAPRFPKACIPRPSHPFLFEWRVLFDELEKKNGFIYQRIQRHFEFSNCKRTYSIFSTSKCPVLQESQLWAWGDPFPQTAPGVYWELWTVINGEAHLGWPPFVGDGLSKAPDTWSREFVAGTHDLADEMTQGWEEMKGEAVFVESKGTAAQLREGKVEPVLGWGAWTVSNADDGLGAGVLAALCGESPKLQALIGGGNVVRRSLSTTWNCCCDPYEKNFIRTSIKVERGECGK